MRFKTILKVSAIALLFIEPASAQVVNTYEAEAAKLGKGCVRATNHAGYSGDAFVGGFYENDRAEITFNVDVTGPGHISGDQPITLRYAAGYGNAELLLTVNGSGQKLTLPATGSWETWKLFELNARLVNTRTNQVSLTMRGKNKNCINLDYLAVGKLKAPKEQFSTLTSTTLTQSEIDERISILQRRAKVSQLVVVVRNFIKSSHNYTYFNEGFEPGGGLYLFGPGGFKQLVDASGGQILDAELSYDGKTVLFSWRKGWPTHYDLYTIDIDGTHLRQLTKHPAHDFNASWLPDGGIAFLSDRDNNYAYCMGSSSAVLYRMQPDGTGLRRLSANYLSDIAPHIMHDGKIMYCRWEYVDRFQIPSQGLWAQNPDGSGLKHLYGGRLLDPVTISEPKSIPGTNKIIATLTGHNGSICGGIGVIDPSKGANNMEGCTEILGAMVRMKGQNIRKLDQHYEFPYPVNESCFLVSNDGNIELANYEGGEVVTLLNKREGPTDSKLGFYAALPVQVREREPLIESAIAEADRDKRAQLIMQDVYIGLEKQLADGTIQRGDIKQIRVAESLGKSNKAGQLQRAFCWQFPVVSGGATMEPKKTITTVEVEADGSAMFEVPPMKALLFQALDKDGKVIHRMRTFTQFMGGEVQSCTGCHMDRNTAVPPNNKGRILALQKPVQKICGAPWTEHETAFSYQEQVQPVWDRNCVQCHNPFKQSGGLDLSGDRTDLFNVSYDSLVRTDINRDPARMWALPQEFVHKYISYIPSYNGCESRYMKSAYFLPKSWGSYQSNLVKLIDSGHPDTNGKNRINLTDLERRQVYAWIDYNVPYYQTSHTSDPQSVRGMREQVPEGFYDLLNDVEARRCNECHTKGEKLRGWFTWRDKNPDDGFYVTIEPKEHNLPLKPFLRWERPELNNFMLAPLAEKDGGTGQCGRAVFEGKDDPDYQKLLHAFDQIHQNMARRPRMDLPGAKEVRVEGHTQLYECLDQP